MKIFTRKHNNEKECILCGTGRSNVLEDASEVLQERGFRIRHVLCYTIRNSTEIYARVPSSCDCLASVKGVFVDIVVERSALAMIRV